MNLKESLSKVYSRRNKQVWLCGLPLLLNIPTLMHVAGYPTLSLIPALLWSIVSIALLMMCIVAWTIINNEIELTTVNKYMAVQGYTLVDRYKKTYSKEGKTYSLKLVYKNPNKIDSDITELLIKEEVAPTLLASL